MYVACQPSSIGLTYMSPNPYVELLMPTRGASTVGIVPHMLRTAPQFAPRILQVLTHQRFNPGMASVFRYPDVGSVFPSGALMVDV